ncbi:MAG TPA: sulfatase-like hydrolase/transferase [Chitinophagaceae bacterium]|nr:sulfatase-like hydrolase/transferase [Chitinophagaceae bacterium]HMZ45515.1 sulfatase-like hydrolase/transferase [Chitinophagaceae bacterium]HNM33907.1 sulfatase-like hydrolase/transferase [Chitinophagaceae bacterium]HNN30488.1 sulfatase-like hydrolase/transferase [Chitinophagaceae bacterium]
MKPYWNIKITVRVYILVLTIFTFFRIILFINEYGRLDETATLTNRLLAFFMGVRFDIVISGYILFFPFVALSILNITKDSLLVKRIIFYFIFILFTLAFLVCAADIPYFNQFFSRFSVTAFEWLNSPMFVLKMIIQEPRYWLFFILFVVVVIIFFKRLQHIFKSNELTIIKNKKWKFGLISLLAAGFIFLGVRGRIDEKSPIRVGTAYFCNNAFLNQLGLNPNFTLMRSWIDAMEEENKLVNLMDEKIAIQNTQKYLQITNPSQTLPISRIENDTVTNKHNYNVVFIIMESMSAAKMKRHGNAKNLTPFLDSISTKGLYFENNYSAGIHTFNGIFSTLFSYPALFRQHPMKESGMFKYNGIASTLKSNNYSTIYFTTHDGQFDNVEGFLNGNDYEQVISKEDYPFGKAPTTLGVPDDYMFEFSIPLLNNLHQKNKPFFAAFMTASNHRPFYIPDYFSSKFTDEKDKIVEYADFALSKFISMASHQEWFKNTIFVFVADHGSPISSKYDLSLDYNHVPLLFYAPEIITKHKTYSTMSGQIDIYPTTMGLLGLTFTNNTLGVNLFKQQRPYIYFNADDKYGVIDSNWLLIVRNDKFKGLYKYRNNNVTNYANEYKDIVNRMQTYAESNLQTFQYLLKNKKL